MDMFIIAHLLLFQTLYIFEFKFISSSPFLYHSLTLVLPFMILFKTFLAKGVGSLLAFDHLSLIIFQDCFQTTDLLLKVFLLRFMLEFIFKFFFQISYLILLPNRVWIELVYFLFMFGQDVFEFYVVLGYLCDFSTLVFNEFFESGNFCFAFFQNLCNLILVVFV